MGETLELEPLAAVAGIDSAQVQSLAESLFGIDQVQLKNWPGFHAYVNYLGERLGGAAQDWIRPAVGAVDSAANSAIHPITFSECVTLISELSLVIKAAPNNSSIDDISRRWLERSGREAPRSNSSEWRACRQAVFCVLTCITLLVQATPTPQEDCFKVEFPDNDEVDNGSDHAHPLDSARRPVCALMRSFCGSKFMLRSDTGMLGGPEYNAYQDTISVSSVNYAMLDEFGKITYEWTDLISCHLLFVPSSRVLYLFRLPTFCALSCIEGGKNSVADQ